MEKSLQPTLTLPQHRPVENSIRILEGSVNECSVSLQFCGDDLIPDEVTHLLGINPTRSYKKGDVFLDQVGEQLRKSGLWLYSVNQCAGLSLEDLLNVLFDSLPADIDLWQELTTTFSADLFFGLRLEQSNRVLDFSQPTLQRISERGLSIGLDLYFEDDEKELDYFIERSLVQETIF